MNKTQILKIVNKVKKRKLKFMKTNPDKYYLPSNCRLPMEYRTRKNYFTSNNGNNTFDPTELVAYSYNWWRFVEKIGNKIVFNNYTYSSCTSKHQRKVLELMRLLGIKIDLIIKARQGLDNLDVAIKDYEYRIKQLQELIIKPKTHKSKNIERQKTITYLLSKIHDVKKLQYIKASKLEKQLIKEKIRYEQFNSKVKNFVNYQK